MIDPKIEQRHRDAAERAWTINAKSGLAQAFAQFEADLLSQRPQPLPQAEVVDETCILRRAKRNFGVTVREDTVICGQRIVEQYLRQGYKFDWHATDKARENDARKDAALASIPLPPEQPATPVGEALVEAVARAVSEAGGASDWQHALLVARAALSVALPSNGGAALREAKP